MEKVLPNNLNYN